MIYFNHKTWTRMDSPVLAVRMLGALQWRRSNQRYSKALLRLRKNAPPSLLEASHIELADSIILGVRESGGCVHVELHGSTRSGLSGRVQLMFRDARLLNRPPRGSWILQEEWSELPAVRSRPVRTSQGSTIRASTKAVGLRNASALGPAPRTRKPALSGLDGQPSASTGAPKSEPQNATATVSASNGVRYLFTALCTRGLLCVDCADASFQEQESEPQSGVQLRTPFGGIVAVPASRMGAPDAARLGARGNQAQQKLA